MCRFFEKRQRLEHCLVLQGCVGTVLAHSLHGNVVHVTSEGRHGDAMKAWCGCSACRLAVSKLRVLIQWCFNVVIYVVHNADACRVRRLWVPSETICCTIEDRDNHEYKIPMKIEEKLISASIPCSASFTRPTENPAGCCGITDELSLTLTLYLYDEQKIDVHVGQKRRNTKSLRP